MDPDNTGMNDRRLCFRNSAIRSVIQVHPCTTDIAFFGGWLSKITLLAGCFDASHWGHCDSVEYLPYRVPVESSKELPNSKHMNASSGMVNLPVNSVDRKDNTTSSSLPIFLLKNIFSCACNHLHLYEHTNHNLSLILNKFWQEQEPSNGPGKFHSAVFSRTKK